MITIKKILNEILLNEGMEKDALVDNASKALFKVMNKYATKENRYQAILLVIMQAIDYRLNSVDDSFKYLQYIAHNILRGENFQLNNNAMDILLDKEKVNLDKNEDFNEHDEISLDGIVINNRTKTVNFGDNPSIQMPNIQFKILYFLMSHPDVFYSRQSILKNVWGDRGYDVNDRNVDVKISQLKGFMPNEFKSKIIGKKNIGYKFDSK